jgi:shikimate kinase
MNLVLIGYRCSGKTRVGRLLAGELKWNFLDTDSLIEEKGGIPIHSYVSRYGWGDFRRLEREVVEAVAVEDNSVIATGGGVVMDTENVIRLKRNGWVVWLLAEAGVIRQRMAQAWENGELRPPLFGSDPLEEIASILRERTPVYDRACDYRVWTDGQTPEAVKETIVMAFSSIHTGGTGGIG